MPAIKALFFDANGVLYYRPEGESLLERFLRQYGRKMLDKQTLRNATGEAHDQALRGEISQAEYEKAVLAACGITEPELVAAGQQVLDLEHSQICLFPGLIETLAALKQRGYKLGVITDAAVPKETKLGWLKAGGLDFSWDAYANSMDLGVRKPHLRMYQSAMEQAGVQPAESIFVGHAEHELVGARAAGMATVAFNYDPGVEADWYIQDFGDLLDVPVLRQAE